MMPASLRTVPPCSPLTSISRGTPTTLSSLSPPSSSSAPSTRSGAAVARRTAVTLTSALAASFLLDLSPIHRPPPHQLAKAEAKDDSQLDEELVVQIFQEASPSVVFIKDFELQARGGRPPVATRSEGEEEDEDLRDAKVEGTGSGFVWDKYGHIVTNYHVVAKLATDRSGLQRCKVFLDDSNGNTFSREGKLIGFDPAYDLAVLKVDVEGDKLKPGLLGTSHDLRVGQSCFAIGNPYGYEHTLTTGVVSGLGREIPSPNGRPIRGAIQTDAAINAGCYATGTCGLSSGITKCLLLIDNGNTQYICKVQEWSHRRWKHTTLEGIGQYIHVHVETSKYPHYAGNSGGPLIDSYGHVIGVNTATFTRKGTGMSSGVNFAIPIDVVVQTVPYLIVYGTSAVLYFPLKLLSGNIVDQPHTSGVAGFQKPTVS